MFRAPRGDCWRQKGVWRGAIRTDGGQRTRTANFSCPHCGQAYSLIGHTIHRDGRVEPSVVCPMEGCGFHDFVILLDWDGN